MPRFDFKIAQMLEYGHVFSGAPMETKEYIQRVGKEKVLMMSSFFANRDWQEMQSNPLQFIYDFFTPLNLEFAAQLVSIIYTKFGNQLQINPLAAINIINPTALYHVIEIALSLPDSSNPNYAVSARDQIDYFRMLLAENTLISRRQGRMMERSVETVLDAIPMMTACQMADWDYSHARLAEVCMAQMFKCVYFFQYAETELPAHLECFCVNNKVETWQKYAQCIINLILPLDSTGGNVVVPNTLPDYEQVSAIMDKLSSGQYVDEDDYDFKRIRNCPLYKKIDSSYMILSKLFLAEKLYKSLYFEFRAINDSMAGDAYIPNFKAYLGLHFAEEYLCAKVLDRSFPNKYIKKSGKDFRDKGLKKAEPDYYVRNKNKAFLFECKDALFESTAKVSFDVDKVCTELRKKLHYAVDKKGRESPKAVQQLLHNAKRLIEEKNIDDSVNVDFVRIYPIIITHDRAFTSPGVNWTINQWWMQEVEKKYPQLKGHVSSLFMIDVDTLILTNTRLKSRRFMIERWLDWYEKKMLLNNHELNQLPFTEFAHGFLFAKGNDIRALIQDLEVLVTNK